MRHGPVKLNLEEVNANAYAMLTAFMKAARQQGWSMEQTNAVVNEAKSQDYDHLIQTLMKNTVPVPE